MSADVKLLSITTDNQDLSRVQANAAEALRRFENNIATAFTTVNTRIYNALTERIVNSGDGKDGWEEFQTGTVSTSSNVFTKIITMTMPPNSVAIALGVFVSSDGAVAFFGGSQNCVVQRLLLAAPLVLSNSQQWSNPSTTQTTDVIANGLNIDFRVRGALNQPAQWRGSVSILRLPN